MTGKNQGFDVVVINYRGLAGVKLKTPKMFCCDSWQDVLEPMTHVYNKYKKDRKYFAIGCSMGGNILGNLLGYEGKNTFIEAACVVQAPIKNWECETSVRSALCGFYDRAFGMNIFNIYLENEPMLKNHVKSVTKIDI